MSDVSAATTNFISSLSSDDELYFFVRKAGDVSTKGSYNCSRCHGNGDQPDTIKHRPGCDYTS